MLWFDFDNTPHVPLFRPVLEELDRRKTSYVVTARDFAQTKQLLELWHVHHTLVGAHAGKSKIKKVLNLYTRSTELKHAVEGGQIARAISHGSRTQVIAAWRMGIPSLVMLDYEYTESRIFNTFARHLLIPAIIPDARLREAGFNLRKVIRYAGFKEELYLKDFTPAMGFRESIGISSDAILVVMRPPSTVGNYHDDRSEKLFATLVEHFSSQPGVQCLLVARGARDAELIPRNIRTRSNVRILERAVDGLQLIWHSDLILSGGGTMNRESALLGVPTFSIFTGRRPFLDEYLQETGKLKFIESPQEIQSIEARKREISGTFVPANILLAQEVTDILEDIRN